MKDTNERQKVDFGFDFELVESRDFRYYMAHNTCQAFIKRYAQISEFSRKLY